MHHHFSHAFRTPMRSITRFMLLSILFAGAAGAQEKNRFSLEIDPATYALGGYAVHLRMTTPALPGWRFGFGAYALDFPDLFVDMNPDNKDESWDVRLDSGIGLFAEFTPGGKDRGWFAGGQVAVQRFQVGNEQEGTAQAEFSTLLLMIHTGYRWFPSASGLYLQPWAGLGYAGKISGETQVGSRTYAVSPVVPFMTLHLGYIF